MLGEVFQRVLSPIVRVLLARGVRFPEAADWLKETFVRAAGGAFRIEGRRLTDSRISLLTGLQRKDVKAGNLDNQKLAWFDSFAEVPDKLKTGRIVADMFPPRAFATASTSAGGSEREERIREVSCLRGREQARCGNSIVRFAQRKCNGFIIYLGLIIVSYLFDSHSLII